MTLLLAVLCGQVGSARATAADDRARAVATLEQKRARLEGEKKGLERDLATRSSEVAALKKQRPSWARDQKLDDKLREAKDLASRLDKKAAELRALDGQLGSERKALAVAAERELPAATTPERKKQLEGWRKLGGAQAARRVEIVDVDIDPLDDPEDLDDKAAALGESESKLRAEEARLARRAQVLRKQARLSAAHERAGQDPFDDSPNHGGSGGAAAAAAQGDDKDPQATSPPPGGPSDDLTGPVGETRGPEENPAAVYVDVVDPQTVSELERAERSGDPEQRAAAAERAVRDLHARAERLAQKRKAMQNRAKALRAGGE